MVPVVFLTVVKAKECVKSSFLWCVCFLEKSKVPLAKRLNKLAQLHDSVRNSASQIAAVRTIANLSYSMSDVTQWFEILWQCDLIQW